MTAAELLGMAQAEGVVLALSGGRLTWKADHQPPAELLAGIKAHRLEIVAALRVANDAQPASSEPRRNAWTITRGGKPICTMVGEPSTRTEALAEARWCWPDADILEN
ncbi:hypothetical protein [Azotobacter chroococcum]|uniref:TubC N-terminal docking domain-containing protein n=1 Tax=Azotobacter chroococcum NCIMB 8003 TaxID=1328314 RepID=A0A0C4WK26_9GAMM|nr:hypothetical protein [Azotobacter chroococcum]AJE20326.1 Hypothetical protein Achr_8380 [Azotobacter chroococcum NCIMB 8003]